MKRRAVPILVASAWLVAVSVFARQLTGPTFSFVWSDSDGKFHPLLGVPGNTTIGDARDTEVTIAQAFSLNGQHFLASSDSDSSVLLIDAAANPVAVAAIGGVPARPSAIAGSRTGTAAALYYSAQQRILILTGLLSTPRISSVVDISTSGEVSRMAVSDDGSFLLYAVPQADHDALFGWTPAAGSRLLTTSDSISAIALTPSSDALIADARANEVFSLVDPRRSATRLFLADHRSGVSNPVGIAVADNGQIYVANAGLGTVLALDSSGTLLRSQQCDCEVGGLFPMKNSLYRLSSRTDGTWYLLEASARGGRIVFVPPYRKNK